MREGVFEIDVLDSSDMRFGETEVKEEDGTKKTYVHAEPGKEYT